MNDDTYPQVLLVVLVVCLAAGLALGLSTSTVALGPYNYDWDGGSDLRTALSANASVEVALSTETYGETPPDETVAVVLGESEQYSGGDRRQLRSFLAQGGTLVVPSSDPSTNALLADLEVTARIHGETVRDDQYNYRDSALVRANGVTDHELVRNVEEITLNHGTILDSNEATPLVNTSALAFLGEEGNTPFEDDPLSTAVDEDSNVDDGTEMDEEADDVTGALRPVMTIEQVGAGTVVVVSDESFVTNAMLDQEGNQQFVRNLATDHEYVLLDYAAGGGLPPLTYATLSLQSSPVLQLLAGLVGLGTIVFWGPTGRSVGRLRDRLAGGGSSGRQPENGLGTQLGSSLDGTPGERAAEIPEEKTLAGYVTAQHPDWDRERVERVTKAIIRQHQQEADDD